MLRALLSALGALASAPRQPWQPGPGWDKQLVRAVARLAKHRRAARARRGQACAEGAVQRLWPLSAGRQGCRMHVPQHTAACCE